MLRMNEEQARIVCDAVAEGRSVRSICRERGFSRGMFYHLVAKNVALIDLYAHACEVRDAGTEEEILEIADAETANTQWQRNRLDARYKVLAARRPQRWGAKLDLQVTNKGNAREAEAKADLRLLRLARYLPQAQLAQAVDIVGEQLPRLADKQTASAVDNNAGADSIFD